MRKILIRGKPGIASTTGPLGIASNQAAWHDEAWAHHLCEVAQVADYVFPADRVTTQRRGELAVLEAEKNLRDRAALVRVLNAGGLRVVSGSFGPAVWPVDASERDEADIADRDRGLLTIG